MKRVIKSASSSNANSSKAKAYAQLLKGYNSESELYDITELEYWDNPDAVITFNQYTDNYGYRASIFGEDGWYELKMFKNGKEEFSKLYRSLRAARIAMGRMSDTWKVAH